MKQKTSQFYRMKELALWRFMLQQLQKNQHVIFMCVVQSNGSSPGRQGFKMAVTERDMCGSIGGGIMEHKFVETAKEILRKQTEELIVKKQIHSKNVSTNQSGMICSGEQTLAVYPVKQSDVIAVEKIIEALEKSQSIGFNFSEQGFFIINNNIPVIKKFEQTANRWSYTERIGFTNYLHIIGGGHVSLAFSKLMRDLDFHVSVYDDRENLNTMQQNAFAHQKFLINYETINELIPDGSDFVVIMTFGYRTDSIVLSKLLHKKFRYLGLLGSKAKVEKMLNELRIAGIEETIIRSIHAPVGMQINSQTPAEIAVSIAAEIIKLKNS